MVKFNPGIQAVTCGRRLKLGVARSHGTHFDDGCIIQIMHAIDGRKIIDVHGLCCTCLSVWLHLGDGNAGVAHAQYSTEAGSGSSLVGKIKTRGMLVKAPGKLIVVGLKLGGLPIETSPCLPPY